jgi:hypothetical protein
MFDSKISTMYRISSRFAKWASIFCKLLPDDDLTIRNRLLELSQSVPLNIAAAGGSHATLTEKQKYFKLALSCALEYSSTLNTLNFATSADKEIMIDGRHIIDILIAFLTEEASVTMLTNENAAAAVVAGINK